MQPVQSIKRKGIDYVRFSPIPMSNLQQKRLINKYTTKILNDPIKQWMITYRRYTNNRWDQLFRFIIQAQVKQLWLSFNLQRNILKDICPVKFPCLLKLYIWQNQINSLQALEYLDAPILQQINLQKNQVTNLRPLRKMLSKSLNQINISYNPVRRIDALEHTFLACQLKGVFTQNRQDQLIVNDLTAFIKFKNQNFTALTVVSMHRIRQFKIEKMLQNRYPNIKLKLKQLGNNYYQNHMIMKVIDTPRLEPQTVSFKSGGQITF